MRDFALVGQPADGLSHFVCDQFRPPQPHPPGLAVVLKTMTAYPPAGDYDERLLDKAPIATRAEKQVRPLSPSLALLPLVSIQF